MTVLFLLMPLISFSDLTALNVESLKIDELSIYGKVVASEKLSKPMKRIKNMYYSW